MLARDKDKKRGSNKDKHRDHKKMRQEPLGITQNGLARAMGVSPNRINDILQGKRVISADTALRLARYFHNTPGFWMNLQSHYEIECAKEKSGITIRAIRPLKPPRLKETSAVGRV